MAELKNSLRVVGVSLLATYFTLSVLLSFAAITEHNRVLDQKEQLELQKKEIQRLRESLIFYIEASQKK